MIIFAIICKVELICFSAEYLGGRGGDLVPRSLKLAIFRNCECFSPEFCRTRWVGTQNPSVMALISKRDWIEHPSFAQAVCEAKPALQRYGSVTQSAAALWS